MCKMKEYIRKLLLIYIYLKRTVEKQHLDKQIEMVFIYRKVSSVTNEFKTFHQSLFKLR